MKSAEKKPKKVKEAGIFDGMNGNKERTQGKNGDFEWDDSELRHEGLFSFKEISLFQRISIVVFPLLTLLLALFIAVLREKIVDSEHKLIITAMFFVAQLLIFAIGTFLAYRAHNPVRDTESEVDKLEAAAKKLIQHDEAQRVQSLERVNRILANCESLLGTYKAGVEEEAPAGREYPAYWYKEIKDLAFKEHDYLKKSKDQTYTNKLGRILASHKSEGKKAEINMQRKSGQSQKRKKNKKSSVMTEEEFKRLLN